MRRAPKIVKVSEKRSESETLLRWQHDDGNIGAYFFFVIEQEGPQEMAGAVTLSERGMQMKDELDCVPAKAPVQSCERRLASVVPGTPPVF